MPIARKRKPNSLPYGLARKATPKDILDSLVRKMITGGLLAFSIVTTVITSNTSKYFTIISLIIAIALFIVMIIPDLILLIVFPSNPTNSQREKFPPRSILNPVMPIKTLRFALEILNMLYKRGGR